MECSQCGEPIDKASLRCRACHFDMLAVDISQKPLPYSDGKVGIVGNFYEAAGYPRPIPGAPAYVPAAPSHNRPAAPIRANERLLWMIVLVAGVLMYLSLRN